MIKRRGRNFGEKELSDLLSVPREVLMLQQCKEEEEGKEEKEEEEEKEEKEGNEEEKTKEEDGKEDLGKRWVVELLSALKEA